MEFRFTSLKAAEYFAQEKTRIDPLPTFYLIEEARSKYIVRESYNGTLSLREGEHLIDTFFNGKKKDK